MKLHPIQRLILQKLLASETLVRFSNLNIGKLDNDHFNYHIKHLVNEALVIKEADGYRLSPAGVKFVEIESPTDPLGNVSELFRVNVLIAVFRKDNKKHEILIQKRTRHPYFGSEGVIGGIVHPGESIVNACRRKLLDETGLVANKVDQIGIIRALRYQANGEMFSDIMFHVCCTDDVTGDLVATNSFGQNRWFPISEGIKREASSDQSTKTIVKILRRIGREGTWANFAHFYIEENQIVTPI